MRKKGRGSNRRPRKHDADTPLSAAGTVGQTVQLPARVPWLAGPLSTLVSIIPSHEESVAGRQLAMAITLVIGGLGIWTVTWGKDDWTIGLYGVLIALSAVFIPLGESRKRRLREAAASLSIGRDAVRPVAAELFFDGRKLTVRAQERVYRSIRPDDPPCTVRIGERGGLAVLGLVPPPGRKRDPLWFTTDRAGLPDAVDLTHGRPEPLSDEEPDGPMHLPTEQWVGVFEAFVYRLDTA